MSKGYKSSQKVSNSSYTCSRCDYTTSKISNYNKHLLTAKHIKVTDGVNKVAKCSQNNNMCICGNVYKHRQGLYRHKHICTYDTTNKLKSTEDLPQHPIIDISLVMDLIKQNKELQNVLIQQSEKIIQLSEREPSTINGNIVNNNNNNTTNNNQKFNLNFFLNETCKDAMSIQEFIENLRITFQDLLTIGNEGFVNGLSDIFIKELRELDVSKRPIHCTDSKRETINFKEEDVWNKDDKEKSKLKGIIEKVEYKNVVALRQWCVENPDANVNNTPNNLLRDKIYLQTLQGDERTRDKIIKNMVKQIIVDKDHGTDGLASLDLRPLPYYVSFSQGKH